MPSEILTLATAGLKPGQLEDVHHDHYPRVDYIELQRLVNTKVMDYRAYDRTSLGGLFRYLETQLRSDIYLAVLALLTERHYPLVFSMCERVGTPLAAMHRMLCSHKPLVSMYTCWSWRQESVTTKLDLFSCMNAIVVKCQSMKHHLVKIGAEAERVHVIPHSIDHRFFSPLTDVEPLADLIMSVGETRTRDYCSLLQAVDGLPLTLLVAASGNWYAREKSTKLQAAAPENVTIVRHVPQSELRTLYAQSQFVVLPVRESVFSSGATAALEAMCMGRAVIANRSPGLADYVIDGETGVLVDPNDAAAMRTAIQDLLAHPEEARRLGRNARQRIEEELNLDLYVEHIAELLRTFL